MPLRRHARYLRQTPSSSQYSCIFSSSSSCWAFDFDVLRGPFLPNPRISRLTLLTSGLKTKQQQHTRIHLKAESCLLWTENNKTLDTSKRGSSFLKITRLRGSVPNVGLRRVWKQWKTDIEFLRYDQDGKIVHVSADGGHQNYHRI